MQAMPRINNMFLFFCAIKQSYNKYVSKNIVQG